MSFVALAAAVLSFSGLHELAVRAGFHPTLAVLFPLATDVAVAAFSLAVLHHRMVGLRAWWPWLCMMLGVAVSVAGNVWAAPPDVVSRLVHAWPPVIFALSFETVTRLVRHRITHAALAAEDAEEAAATDVTVTPAAVKDEAPAVAVAAAAAPERHLAAVPEPTTNTTAQAKPAAQVDEQRVTEQKPQEETAPAPATATETAPAEAVKHEAPMSADTGPAAKAQSAPEPKREAAPVRPKAARTGTVREQIVDILREAPDTSAAQIARDLGRDRSYVSKIVREVKKELAAETPAASAPTPKPQPDSQPDPEQQETPAAAPETTNLVPATPDTMGERLATPAPAVIDVPQSEGTFETVPFPNVAPRLIPVPEAKRAVYEATGENADVSSEIWTRLDLPTANEETVSQAQLDEALSLVRSLEVAGVR